MNDELIDLDRLRAMIGREVEYQGMACEVIEVLEDGPSIVLRMRGHQDLQMDQYEETARRVPGVLTIPVFTHDRSALSPAFTEVTA